MAGRRRARDERRGASEGEGGRIRFVPKSIEAPTSSLPAAIHAARRIAIRAGSAPHRFTSLWAVVVDGRVFVRSWSVKPRSWYRTLLVEPHGVARLKAREIRFRAVPVRSAALRSAVDRAYVEKYDHPGDVPYTQDMVGRKSRATTTELLFGEALRAALPRSRTGRAPRARAASHRRSRARP
jgi:hypothetical protein